MRFTLPSFVVPAAAVVAGTALVFAGATGAQAATAHTAHSAPVRHVLPAAPTAVAATGTSASVTLNWKSGRSPFAVTGYTIALSPAKGQAHRGVVTTHSSARTASFAHLTAGTTYSLGIVANGRWGHSKTVTVKYTPKAAPAAQSVFALDTSSNLVRVPATGGMPVTLSGDVGAYTVDAAGDAYAITSTGVIEVAASGAKTTFVSGETPATDIQLDGAGNVYLLEGTSVVRVAAGTHRSTTIATEPAAPIGFSVSASGAVSLFEATSAAHSIVTYPAGGGTPKTTVLTDSAYYSPLTATFDAKGNAFSRSTVTGASGSLNIQRFAAGSTAPTLLGGGYVRGGVGLTDDYYLLQSASFCTSVGLGMGTCVPDLKVANIQITSDTGVTSTVSVTGLSLGTGDEHGYSVGTSITSDTAGTIYIASQSGITSYAKTGGAPTSLAAGSFSDVQLNR